MRILALLPALLLAVRSAAEPGGPDEPVRVNAAPIDLAVHDGRLRPAIGVENIQVFRANRTRPNTAENTGWTYNHAPMLAYWNGRFYLEYLSNPFSEANPPGQTLVATSRDGRTWEMPTVVFPVFWLRTGPLGRPRMLMMHQRMGFYVAPNGRLLVLASYGYEPSIGRVVRNANADGTYGPIYFIRNHAEVTEGRGRFPFYTDSPDRDFVAACDALLADKLKTAQWREEDSNADGFYTVPGPLLKAPSIYHRRDGTAVALFKEAWAALSSDEGKTWSMPVQLPSVITDGAKSWGQRTEDGRYAMVYNPADFGSHRWPLAIVTGEDGIVFSDMLLINGEVPPRRYYGGSKDFGMQYVRGISEGNGDPPGSDLWLVYSSNKEDMWISRVPVPVRARAENPVSDTFDALEAGGKIPDWNIYRPRWAQVGVVAFPNSRNKSLRLEDSEPYDYAKAVRVFPESKSVWITCRILARQADRGRLEIDVMDGAGNRAVQLRFDDHGKVSARKGETSLAEASYRSDSWHRLEIIADTAKGKYDLTLDGRAVVRQAAFAEPAASLERIEFRTGAYRTQPTRDLDRYAGEDLANPGDPAPAAIFHLDDLVIR
ncbi:MAG: hypothetical protein JNG83_11225 [Opitutaceae bacterium]|nr:hypothetical protein [Opitutaceae bacterium]